MLQLFKGGEYVFKEFGTTLDYFHRPTYQNKFSESIFKTFIISLKLCVKKYILQAKIIFKMLSAISLS